MKLYALSIGLLILSGCSGDDSAAKRAELTSKGEAEHAKGHLAAALAAYEKAAALTDPERSPVEWADAQGRVANALTEQTQYARAAALLEKVVSVYEAKLAPDDRKIAMSLIRLSGLYQSTNRLPEAEQTMQRTIEIFEKANGPDHRNVATALATLVRFYQAHDKQELAVPLLQRIVSIDEKQYGPDDPNVTPSMLNLADTLGNANKPGDAEPVLRHAMSILVKSQQRTGHEQPAVPVFKEKYTKLMKTLGLSEADSQQRMDVILRGEDPGALAPKEK